MALNKVKLKEDIKLLTMDMLDSTDRDSALEVYAENMADIIHYYVSNATVVINPLGVSAALMSNGGGPVVAANNLLGKLE